MALSSTIDTVNRLIAMDGGLEVCYDPTAEPAVEVEFHSPPSGLHPQLAEPLARRFPDGLFRHQRAALDNLLLGRHTVVATRTSSGKSLIYTIPVFDRLLTEPDSTALFLFPQKALANDQLQRLAEAADHLPTLAPLRAAKRQLIARYDGATPQDLKPQVRAD